MTGKEILALPMEDNGARADTIGEYLKRLLLKLVKEQEGFSSKRPFGSGKWYIDLCIPLVKAGVVSGTFSTEPGCENELHTCDDYMAEQYLVSAVEALFQ